MGWGLTVKEVYFSRVTKQELPSVLEDAEDDIRSAKESLLILAASTPRTVEDGPLVKRDWNEHIKSEVTSIMESLEESIIRRYLATICIENPDDVTES